MNFDTNYDFRYTLTEEQKKNHIVQKELETIETIRYKEAKKRTKDEIFHEFTTIKDGCNNEAKDPRAIYEIPNHIKASYIVRSTLEYTIPVLTVKDDYINRVQVRWKKNLCCLTLIKATMKDLLNTGISFNIDGYSQFIFATNFLDKGSKIRSSWFRNIGNLQELTEWSTQTPSRILTVPQFWPYSNSTYEAYPLFIYPSHNNSFKIEHIYEFNLNVSKLICVRYLEEDGTYKRIKNKEEIKKYIQFIPNLNFPRLEITFSQSHPLMDRYIKTCLINKNPDNFNIYYREWIPYKKIATTYNRCLKEKIISENMCLALFWSINKRNEFSTDPYKTFRKKLPLIKKSSFGNDKYEEERHWSFFSFERYTSSLKDNEDNLGLLHKSFGNSLVNYISSYYPDGKIFLDDHNIYLTTWSFPKEILIDSDTNSERYELAIDGEDKDLILNIYLLISKHITCQIDEQGNYNLITKKFAV